MSPTDLLVNLANFEVGHRLYTLFSSIQIKVINRIVFFKSIVDASQAGEGQLEISINDGEVPNHVQVLGGGKCLVSFTPEIAKVHTIEVMCLPESCSIRIHN